MNIHIVTNNQPRSIIYWYELSAEEKKEFDYLEDNDDNQSSFFRYKGCLYDLGEFMPISKGVSVDTVDHFKGWHGVQSDSFFSGILYKYTDDYDYVIVGRYYS